jgi:hypothetical protein
MKKLSLMLALFLLPVAVYGAEPYAERPHWSLEVKGGMFYPDIENWKDYFGSDKTSHYAATLAYKLIRQIEIGMEGGYIRDKGQGFAIIHNEPAGSVTYELYPLEAFILLRGVFSEGQWLVPYVGGGWTRMYYREKVEFQEDVKGYTDGYHGRAGIQLLLDGLDQDAANSFYLEYGVHHTYLFFEAQYTRAMIDTVATATTPSEKINLGGTSFLAGLLFEF